MSFISDSSAVISCVFGDSYHTVYESIPGRLCYFFSNNKSIRAEAELKGWVFKFVKTHPLTLDFRLSSMQSKYIKYLQFFGEFPEFYNCEKITYFDHKFKVCEKHLLWIDEVMKGEKSILIRNTPRIKNSIKDEIRDAKKQKRYRCAMRQTIAWLNNEIKLGNFVLNNRVMNTGFIVYKNLEKIMPLLDKTYEKIWLLGQPECQIIWAALAQEYEAMIQRVEWSDLNPLWEIPS